ncbi:putative ripening-related protein 5 [Lolium rigidum]|uniref:putative ripening-related protein 5 n=1 Tax=Lolium rigidum TaxID=89674 RepID=UPI001F5CA024|nr:putative ripening-related protein 5 [Lolium rigidum]XP_051210822.1 putative ripening-related protein 5 [Lolium perenne]
MATSRALAALAIFLLVALSISHIASALRPSLGVCHASGYLPGKSGNCEKSNDPDCCEDGKRYPQFHCSPPVTASTKAILTLNSFEKGKDGGGPSECDNAYHSDEEMVVALSTGWFKNMGRCGHRIKINANGKSVYAKVVDECDSVYGCDEDHNYEPPCANNIVDASPAVWNALGLDQNVGMEDITWSDGCHASGYLPGKSGNCEKSNDPDCCEDGKRYPQFHCSPPVTASTKAVLTLNSFEKGKDGGGPSECDNAYHSNEEMVVALSTGWFENMGRCGHRIKINANGKSVYAKVVDECDSVYGCDEDHNYEPPCANNIVDASPAVWNALGLDQNVGMEGITWSDGDN